MGGRRGWLGCVVGVQWLLVVACKGGVEGGVRVCSGGTVVVGRNLRRGG